MLLPYCMNCLHAGAVVSQSSSQASGQKVRREFPGADMAQTDRWCQQSLREGPNGQEHGICPPHPTPHRGSIEIHAQCGTPDFLLAIQPLLERQLAAALKKDTNTVRFFAIFTPHVAIMALCYR